MILAIKIRVEDGVIVAECPELCGVTSYGLRLPDVLRAVGRKMEDVYEKYESGDIDPSLCCYGEQLKKIVNCKHNRRRLNGRRDKREENN